MRSAPVGPAGRRPPGPCCAAPIAARLGQSARSSRAVARDDRRHSRRGRELHQQRRRPRALAVAGRGKGLGPGLKALALRPVPALDRGRRPGGVLVGVAVVAGVGDAKARREIRARDAEAVIVARVDHHVGPLGHVAGGAARRGRAFRMVMMRGGAVLRLLVTLVADAVALRPQLERMRLVAVAAADALREHLALAERGVVVDLVQHLAVGLEQAGLEEARHVRLEELLPGAPAFGDLGAAGMADAAGLELLGAGPRRAADGVAGGGVDGPMDALRARRSGREPVIAALARAQPALPAARPRRHGPSRDRGRPRSRRRSRPRWSRRCWRRRRSSCAARSCGTRRT